MHVIDKPLGKGLSAEEPFCVRHVEASQAGVRPDETLAPRAGIAANSSQGFDPNGIAFSADTADTKDRK